MKEIRDWLNENGIKNPVGGAFTYNSVEHIDPADCTEYNP